jgi:MFS family permease
LGCLRILELSCSFSNFLISLISTLVNVFSTPISFYLAERVNRRNLLILGGTGMVISQYLVGIIGVTVGQDSCPDTNKSAVSARGSSSARSSSDPAVSVSPPLLTDSRFHLIYLAHASR